MAKDTMDAIGLDAEELGVDWDTPMTIRTTLDVGIIFLVGAIHYRGEARDRLTQLVSARHSNNSDIQEAIAITMSLPKMDEAVKAAKDALPEGVLRGLDKAIGERQEGS